jgi:hypothetical protein
MSAAGYCQVCGRNVWLTDSGGCENGHPPECVSAAYEVDAGPTRPPVALPSTQTPRDTRRGPGLLISVIAGFLLVWALASGWQLIHLSWNMQSAEPARRSTPMDTIIGFEESTYAGSELTTKKYLPPVAQKALTQEEWSALDAATTKPRLIAFSASRMNGDGTATVTYTIASRETGWQWATLVFSVDPDDSTRVKVDRTQHGKTKSEVVRSTRASDGTYYVAGMDYGGDYLAYDAGYIRSKFMAATSPAGPSELAPAFPMDLGASSLGTAVDFMWAQYAWYDAACGDCLSEVAHGAITDSDWRWVDDTTWLPSAVFGVPVVEGADRVTMNYQRTFSDGRGDGGTLTFQADPSIGRVLVTDTADGGAIEMTQTIQLTRESGNWVVLGGERGGKRTRYDASFARSMLQNGGQQ